MTVILRAGGSQFNAADPETWRQATRLAANRDWTRLDALKAQLVGGVRKPAETGAEEATRNQTVEIAADDLTIIEGIGPKIEELLNQNEIRTFAQLAETPVEDLTAMLRAGGSQFNAADPETWPRQARLAANRDWTRLGALKAQLVGGVRRGAVEEESTRAPAVVETPDDLTLVEGIGPKIEELLNKYGIRTFEQLAASDVAELTAILRTGGNQFNTADPETWPRQAQLAVKGDWAELEALKAQLVEGVRRPAMEEEPLRTAPVSDTPDDLTIIEGIGPKLAELLDENGIHTFARLARTDVLRLRIILDSGGSKFKQADPSSWPEQAALAAAGEWGKLRDPGAASRRPVPGLIRRNRPGRMI
ncbi:MAG: hypothetical protein IPK16_17350 [Anaerolineales bacterium]|nr:hypothetical protein [Anaerolineales bacterium]